jgi:hypothetical protein
MPQAQPELKKVSHPYFTSAAIAVLKPSGVENLKYVNAQGQYLDKRLFVQLNGSRKVLGVLRGYDVGCL